MAHPLQVVVSPAGRTLGARPATAPGRRRVSAAPAQMVDAVGGLFRTMCSRLPCRRRVRHSVVAGALCDCILEASAPPAGDDDSRGYGTSPAARDAQRPMRHTGDAVAWA